MLKNKEYQQLNDRIIKLMHEGMPKEEMDEIVSISKHIEKLDEEYANQVQSNFDLKKEFVETFKQTPANKEDHSEPHARSLEEIIADIKKGKW